MSTLSIPMTNPPQSWLASGFSRFLAVVSAVLDVYGDALRQAHEAQQRYPYATAE